LIIPEIEGPNWITGGDFGIEASIISVFICLAAGLWLLRAARRKKQPVRPLWIRKRLMRDESCRNNPATDQRS
jgi:hypothetical protein